MGWDIYLKNDDEDGDLSIDLPGWPTIYPGELRAEVLLRGLLRWKRERTLNASVAFAIDAMMALLADVDAGEKETRDEQGLPTRRSDRCGGVRRRP